MKKYLFFVVSLVLVSCSDQQIVNKVDEEFEEQTPASEVTSLTEKARWGDGSAYVKLADCYRDGKGIKRDFIGMVGMISFADEYGGINRMEDYILSLPEDSEYRLVFDALEIYFAKKHEEALVLAEKLIAQDCTEGYTIKGIIKSEQGDKEEGDRLLQLAVENGSGFAALYQCAPDLQNRTNPDITKLIALADKLPIANTCLGKIFTGKDDESNKNEQLAAYYYQKADKNACLGKDGARWLLNYQINGGNIELDEKDIERLRILAGRAILNQQYEDVDEIIEIVDTTAIDI